MEMHLIDIYGGLGSKAGRENGEPRLLAPLVSLHHPLQSLINVHPFLSSNCSSISLSPVINWLVIYQGVDRPVCQVIEARRQPASARAMAALFSTRLGRQASGYLQDKYKQARLALGDITPAELYVCSLALHLNVNVVAHDAWINRAWIW
jgi:hypothetical protein